MIIDETYAMDPTAYTPDQLLATWNMSADELAGVPAWANRKVGWPPSPLCCFDTVVQHRGCTTHACLHLFAALPASPPTYPTLLTVLPRN